MARVASKRETRAVEKRSFWFLNFVTVLGTEVLFVAFLGLTVFYYLALASFNPFDESPVSANFPPTQLTNMAGIFGANISSYTFYLVGVAAFLLPLPLLHLAYRAMKRGAALTTFRAALGWTILLASVLVAVSAYVGPLSYHQAQFSSGGTIGQWIAGKVIVYLGRAGMGVVIATSVCCSLLLISGIVLFNMAHYPFGATLRNLPNRCFSAIFRRGRKIGEAANIGVMDEGTGPVCSMDDMTHINDALIDPNAYEKQGMDDRDSNICDPKYECADDIYERPFNYIPPSADIFRVSDHVGEVDTAQKKQHESIAEQLKKAFGDFGIKGDIVAIQPGPAVTVFEFQHNAGTKLSKMTALTDDIALALKVDSIFIHPVSGKNAIGVQVPNIKREMVFFGDIVRTPLFQTATSPLTFVIGKTLKGEAYCADLAAMPHLLMAGQTGSGKSVAINAILSSIVMRSSPDEVKMILVDPKILELKVYEGIPHLLMPVITEPKRAASALKWATQEMDRRYRLMELAKVRHIQGFNQYWESSNQEKRDELFAVAGNGFIGRLPYIIVVIDELADLMLTAPKEVEASIQRLAQKARACGIHLVLATQRPSVDVITGVIKANLPCRIAFKVFSRVDSRTILDSMGAEKLLGKGDMLYLRPGSSKLERLQGAFLEDDEVINLVETLKQNSESRYDEEAIGWIDNQVQSSFDAAGETEEPASGHDLDVMWDEACGIAEKYGVISASFLQRHLKIGYNRAARVVETMERKGFVGPADGSKPRKWLGVSASASR